MLFQFLKIDLQLDPDVMLPSYLIKPIQRICKYPLLIKELIRFTEDSDPQKGMLREALTAMQQTTVFINELKRRRECMAAVAEVEKKITNWKGCDLRCYGELKIEATLMMILDTGTREVGNWENSKEEQNSSLIAFFSFSCSKQNSSPIAFSCSRNCSCTARRERRDPTSWWANSSCVNPPFCLMSFPQKVSNTSFLP